MFLGQEVFLKKLGSDLSDTHNVSYDYLSVMHSQKYVLSNGHGPTIITKDPKFQNVIGQKLDMSPRDAQKLKLLYKCGKSIVTIQITKKIDFILKLEFMHIYTTHKLLIEVKYLMYYRNY